MIQVNFLNVKDIKEYSLRNRILVMLNYSLIILLFPKNIIYMLNNRSELV